MLVVGVKAHQNLSLTGLKGREVTLELRQGLNLFYKGQQWRVYGQWAIMLDPEMFCG